MKHLILAFTTLLLLAFSPADAAEPTVYVVLWFDTEDYILPASDDATLKVADWLRQEEITATFKIVGEKARVLEKRGRKDVIDALKKHDIGYHSNYHSVQPTPAIYMSALGWDEGVAEFTRREKPGYDDVKRIFGKNPSCYGQPGSSWGPQSYGSMRKWGIPMYLDYGKHVGLDRQAHYYGGALNIYDFANTIRSNLGGDADAKQAQDRFSEVHKKLIAKGGGVISIYYHPCEFVHNQFWDGANFNKGANPPRELWKKPLAKTEQESKIAYDTFFSYIRYIQRFTDVKFITAKQALELHRDLAMGKEFGVDEIKLIAAGVLKEVNFQKHDDIALAPSDILDLLNTYLVDKVAGRDPKQMKLKQTPFGPAQASLAMQPTVVTDASQFTRTAADVKESMSESGRVPSTIWLGSEAVTPEAYLVALAKVTFEMANGKAMPEKIKLTPTKLVTEKHVAEDNPKLWGWVIFPDGFRAPEMMMLAKRQAWTLKPAIFHNGKSPKK